MLVIRCNTNIVKHAYADYNIPSYVMYTYTDMHVFTYAYIYMYVHINANKCICAHTYIHTYIHTFSRGAR